MIEGVVNANYEPVVTLPLRGPDGREQEIEAVVDTGFNGYLTLPSAFVAELGLAFLGNVQAELANGSWDDFDVYGVSVLWDGQPRYVPADQADATPLVGMALMNGHDLHVRVTDGGRVVIRPAEAE